MQPGGKPAFGKKQGESVTIPLVPALTEPASAQLSENSNIPELPFNYKVQTVIVREFGQSVPYRKRSCCFSVSFDHGFDVSIS